MSSLWRFGLIAVLMGTLGLLAVQAAGADGISSSGTRSLATEEFLVQDVTLTLDCDPSRVSTVHFSASGPATGPYPGTFTAQGTVTIAPQTLTGPRPGTVAGPLLGLDETFTITSPLGDVTGTKTLPPGGASPNDSGSCQHVNGFAVGPVSNASGTVVDISSSPVYTAVIQDAQGRSGVQGDALLSFSELNLDGVCAGGSCHYRIAGFDQFFLTSTPLQHDGHNDEGMESNVQEQVETNGA